MVLIKTHQSFAMCMTSSLKLGTNLKISLRMDKPPKKFLSFLSVLEIISRHSEFKMQDK